MGKFGEMASWRNEKWAKMNWAKWQKGRKDIGQNGKRAKLERAKKEWAKREKLWRNGNGGNWIGQTGNKPYQTVTGFNKILMKNKVSKNIGEEGKKILMTNFISCIPDISTFQGKKYIT